METIKLDLIPGKKMPSLHASQYDDGREHGIDLFENGVVYKLDGTETLTINERKGDGCICSLDIENTFADSNHIVFASTEQMCAVWGNNICELVIAKGEKTIGTLNFILEIEQSPTEGGIESESEISNLERQITEITEEVIGEDYYTAEETDEAISEAVEDINNKIASEYDEEETYYRGDIVLYNGVLYECDNTDASGEFSPSDWKEITLGEGIENVRDLLADYYTKSQSDYRFLGKSNPSGTGYFSLNRRGSAGAYSVSVGRINEASAQSSFAEGEGNTSSGYASHSEGYGNAASGLMAHAEGVTTESSGYGSHSEGVGTIANHIGQHVIGTYNVADPSTAQPTAKGNYIEIVGNGTDDNRRRNARTLDWSGNETLMGDLTYNGNKSLTSEISRLDGRIDNLPAPMIFKGTLGVGGTIQTLPTASTSNEGYTYKVITDGTYAGQTAKVGDVFTSNGSAWVYIPSGDEDNDTWRAIKVEGVEKLGNGISSGAVDFVGSENIEINFDGNGNKVGVKTKNIYTKEEVDDIVYNILPDDTASGSVANFTTSLELPVKSLEVDVNAVQSAGTPTPATSLPISGWSEISLVKCGANLWNGEWEEGAISNTTGLDYSSTNYWRTVGLMPIKPNTEYYICSPTGVNGNSIGLRFYGADKSFVGYTVKSGYGAINRSFVSPDNAYFLRFNPTNANCPNHDISLNYPSTDTTYHNTFNGTTEVINLGGTYYGGKLTQDKDGHRQFVVESIGKRINEFNNWQYLGEYNYFECTVENMKVSAATSVLNGLICECYATRTAQQAGSGNVDGSIAGWAYSITNETRLRIKDNDFNNVSNWLSSMGNYLVVYPLATPIIIDLPDGEPIATLIGTNNIFADTGDTSVVFKDSVNGYVEKKIASVQALALNT